MIQLCGLDSNRIESIKTIPCRPSQANMNAPSWNGSLFLLRFGRFVVRRAVQSSAFLRLSLYGMDVRTSGSLRIPRDI